MGATPVTDSEWKIEVLGADGPVLVDFWAEWCGPCRLVVPILDQLAEDRGDQIRVLKLDVDANPETAREYNVMSIPTIIVFKDGAVEKRIVGATAKAAMMEELSDYIS